MELVGVEIVKVMSQKTYKMMTPYSSKPISSRKLPKLLEKLGKTRTDLILDVNKIRESDLPICEVCGENHVSLGSKRKIEKLDIRDPIVRSVCSNKSCRSSMRGRASNTTRFNNGDHPLQNLSSEQLSDRNSKSIKTALSTGTHVSQTSSKDELLKRGQKAARTKKANGTARFYTSQFNHYYKSELVMKKLLEWMKLKFVGGNKAKIIKYGDSGKFYRLDFYLPDHNLCIECDGSSHKVVIQNGERVLSNYEKKRDQILLDNGIKTIRFHGKSLFNFDELKDLLINELMKLKICGENGTVI